MTEKVYVLNVYNTITGDFELVQVTKAVFDTYRRTKWNIKDNDKRFFDNEIQMSSLIGGEYDSYENFREFVDYEDTPENAAIEEMLRQSLRNILNLLSPEDYELVYDLYYRDRSEYECARKMGITHQAVHKRKKRVLRKLKNFLDTEGC